MAASPELNKTSHVIKDFVIDYNSDAEENLMEYERYDEGLTYRYVYGVDKLGVTAYTIANGSASVTTDAGEIPLYYHMDHMGSSEFLTSDVTQRVTSWTSYDEWGNITHNAVLKCGTRELDLVKTYTGHERDSVLGQYYAKARMYDTADKHGSSKGNKLGDKRFTAVDPVKGDVRNPQSLVQYTYVLNNPLMYVDPLGMMQKIMRWPGEVHDAVQGHILKNHPGYSKNQMILYDPIGFGFADIISPEGAVWEVKSSGAVKTEKKLEKAYKQIDKYVNNTWKNNPEQRLTIGHPLIQGEFTLEGKYNGFYVKYYCIGHGIIKYEYEQKINEKQIEQDINAAAQGVVKGIIIVGGSIYVIVSGGVTGFLADASVNANELGIKVEDGQTVISLERWVA